MKELFKKSLIDSLKPVIVYHKLEGGVSPPVPAHPDSHWKKLPQANMETKAFSDPILPDRGRPSGGAETLERRVTYA